MKQGRRAQKFILLHWWTSVIWRMPNWRQSTKNTKVELYSEETAWKMILDLMQYWQNQDHQHHKWRQQRSWISYPDCQGAQDKQLTQYLLIPRSKWKVLKIIENSKIGMSRHLDSSTTTLMAKIMVQYGRPTRSSWAKSVWSSFGRTVMEKGNLRKSYWNTVGRKFPIGNAYSYTVKKDFFNRVCGWHQIGWKETKYESDVEGTKPRSWFRRTNIILDHVYLGCTQRQC